MRTGLIMKIAVAIVAAIVLMIGLWFLGWKLEFWGTQMERKVIKESHAYQEGKVSQLLQLYEEYLKVETDAQKTYLILRMRIESERVGEDGTPEIVNDLLRRSR